MQRDPTWLAEKNAYEVHTSIHVNRATGSVKGTTATPYTVCCGGGGGPSAYVLPTNNYVPTIWEPSNGCYANFGSGTSTYDDGGHNYCATYTSRVNGASTWGEKDFFNLCGPGAADVALYYWPAPPNMQSSNSVTDTSPMTPSSTTYWTSERTRAYLTYLAWEIGWPSGGLPHPGMMDNSAYPSYGTTLYGMVDALNWEESGRSTLNGFYVIQWWNGTNQTTLHTDIVSDTYGSSVPVVAEVDASDLPNWQGQGGNVHHFITIIGYDDTHGTYSYTDTCGKSTSCNGNSAAKDGGVTTVPQSTMWKAITDIPVNTSTAPYAGDGGWVW